MARAVPHHPLSARFADLAPTYEAVCAEMDWPLDSAKLDAMRAANAAKLEVPVVRNLSLFTSKTLTLPARQAAEILCKLVGLG